MLTGFIVNALPLLGLLMQTYAMMNMNLTCMKLAACYNCIVGLLQLVWWIFSAAMRFSASGYAISGTSWSGAMANVDANFQINDMCDTPGSPLMCSTGLLVLVLDIIWFVGMGLCVCCCLVGLLCAREQMSNMKGKMMGGM